jgi:hypothetical protein
VDPPGQGLDGQIRGQAPGHPRLEFAERLAVRGLQFERGAELRLTAGSADEDDQVPGDGQGRLPAEVFLDQGEGEVDTGRDPGRGVHVPVPDEDRVGVHGHPGVLPSQALAVRPVSGGPAGVEDPRRRQEEGAGTD